MFGDTFSSLTEISQAPQASQVQLLPPSCVPCSFSWAWRNMGRGFGDRDRLPCLAFPVRETPFKRPTLYHKVPSYGETFFENRFWILLCPDIPEWNPFLVCNLQNFRICDHPPSNVSILQGSPRFLILLGAVGIQMFCQRVMLYIFSQAVLGSWAQTLEHARHILYHWTAFHPINWEHFPEEMELF